MLGFPTLAALKAEYSTEAGTNLENMARSAAQSESAASGGQRPGIGSWGWNRNPEAPPLPHSVSWQSGARSCKDFVCSCCVSFRMPWGVLLGDVRDLGRWSSWISSSCFSICIYMMRVLQLTEPVLFVPAVDASKYQDDSPIVENELQGFHGTRSSILPLILIQGLRSSKRSHGVTGVWMTKQRSFCYEWLFIPFELFAGAAVHPGRADRAEQEEWQAARLRVGYKDRIHGLSIDNMRGVRGLVGGACSKFSSRIACATMPW